MTCSARSRHTQSRIHDRFPVPYRYPEWEMGNIDYTYIYMYSNTFPTFPISPFSGKNISRFPIFPFPTGPEKAGNVR